ncbi:PDK/BCKDK family protein kinase [Ascoidea rubescens DSM 1968]|uniref:Protein-serine/threonine kinase n=1 Tax=Ascoidea rubescens DSM 1968 TaxID=1344418 RepID=A0A1D2VSI0_9ASCO|nr:subunit of the RNA polymerase II mediator complex [Ascoidea rubescens DSM 1968]ODV64515.1 subunit of the RNA polymerase II mediator complex [Ascoidea rubescens DSM 1968]
MSAGWKLNKKVLEDIHHYARFQPSGISLRQMVQFGHNPSQGSLFRASQFVAEELPIRLAHRVKELDELPDGLNEMPSILKVKNWYSQSFNELTSLPKPKLDDDFKKMIYGINNFNNVSNKTSFSNANNHEFSDDGVIFKQSHHFHDPLNHSHPDTHNIQKISQPTNSNIINVSQSNKKYYVSMPNDIVWPSEVFKYNKILKDTLFKIKRRHDPTVVAIAQGVKEWKDFKNILILDSSIQSFLDRFYMSRIGIRMLIGQQIALNEEPARDDYVGIICLNTNVQEIAQDAIDNARFICEQYYSLYEAPKVELYCANDINFMYVPSHLIHMLYEILKNSLRATVEFHSKQPYNKGKDLYDMTFPPIKVIVAEGNEDITIKISDEGGGIPRSAMPLIWTYLYTTVKNAPNISEDNVIPPSDSSSQFIAPMAGLGYGLSLSRLYARYFGGDLKLISMEGYGTDAYLHLNKLGSSSEPLQ